MNDQLNSLLPSTLILGTIAAFALIVTRGRVWAVGVSTRGAAGVAAVVVAFQAAHFAEELFTGFYERFPALFGIDPMPLSFFVLFNIAWLVIWSLSVWGLFIRHRAALFPLWFLAIGCIANGIGHPLFALATRGYFPGLITSPVVGVMGVLLMRRLLLITHRTEPPNHFKFGHDAPDWHGRLEKNNGYEKRIGQR